MARIRGLTKDEVSGEVRHVYERQEQQYGTVLCNHAILARRPRIFRGFRAMWDGLGDGALLPSRLVDLINVKVATIIGCGL